MREILFRGKRKDNDNPWIYGHLHKMDGYGTGYTEYGIQVQDTSTSRPWSVLVIPETISEFTGLTDRNGKKIFEGDIVEGLFLHSMPVNSVVAFSDGSFGLLWNRAGAETFWAFTSICNVEYEVIGNIHDNPELLKGE
jgi:uncharacterized phage protein (TIGR01671 family)